MLAVLVPSDLTPTGLGLPKRAAENEACLLARAWGLRPNTPCGWQVAIWTSRDQLCCGVEGRFSAPTVSSEKPSRQAPKNERRFGAHGALTETGLRDFPLVLILS